ncbi:flagellar basal-body rod protein FlgC [Desulfitobacterium hafniense DCB-2]|nr:MULTISPECIES: flagellar basal body rod protein FlgC [Desulfitobacterium]ACL22160.1 flagellar basal-body rod protein FlgC [Desulfitobacterium hafniense DCB-2]MEA5021294.1 flagellar basal body rod protein FlgC [Desulfitobacterium hafniense]SHN80995.1 flagellar basal-body rod protein FlgC [Desulfitobacterium chlororespirans DSM 11544]
MGIFGSMDISASGLTAQRLRLDVISNNIANINTTRTGQLTEAGNQIPYQRQVVVFKARGTESSFAETLNQALQGRSVSTTALLQGQTTSGATGNGVEVQAIAEDTLPFRLEYNPDSPDAAQTTEDGIPAGYVRMPNVNIVTEMVDMISASRAYEANVTALNASKAMMSKALEIGKG